MTPGEDPRDDLSALRALGPVEPAATVGDGVRRRALEELEAASAPGGASWWRVGGRVWTRVALPVGLTVTVLGYLSWAVSAASAVYH
jgi:hypothetical protein